jgi:chemotaxis protein methyltransferase CheR
MTGSQAMETIVDKVADLLAERIGLRADPTLRGRLRRAVRDEAAASGHALATYFDTVLLGGDAQQSLLNRVTVQETAFFRHPEHFEVLARDLLPTLPRPVTIWSAGCANGQEAFSLAMLLEEQYIDGRVIATDLSTAALQRTTEARYSGRELSGLSAERIAIHTTPTGNSRQVNRVIRERVTALRHNLLDPLPTEVLSSQVVFCRNVLIYLSPEHARAFLDRIAGALPTTSPLFLGAAETIWQVSDRFKAIPTGDTFLYRQAVGAAGAARPAPPRRTGATRSRVESAVGSRRVVTPDRADPRPPRPVTRPLINAPNSSRGEAGAVDELANLAQNAIAAGDYHAAVVAFRKCAYLAPHDPLPKLNLGLALQAVGDERSAQRAYAAARRALLDADPAHGIDGIDGIAAGELIRLLDAKQREATR